MTALPQSQPLQALALANQTRYARAVLKQAIFDRKTTVVAVLQDIPDHAQTMPIHLLLEAQLRWGPSRARKLLAVAQIRDGKTLGELTERQRNVICDLLNWGVA